MAANSQYGMSMVPSFEEKMPQENPILSDMADWEPVSQTAVGFPPLHTIEVKKCSAILCFSLH